MTQFFETTQGIMAMGALIGAGGLAAGSLLPIVIRLAKSGINRRPKAEVRNLAMLTVLALDDFVGASYAAVHDMPEFNPMDEGQFAFHVPIQPLLFRVRQTGGFLIPSFQKKFCGCRTE